MQKQNFSSLSKPVAEKRYDQSGEVLPNPFLLLPWGPEGTGAQVDEEVQLDPEDGAWSKDAGPSRVCKVPRVNVNCE